MTLTPILKRRSLIMMATAALVGMVWPTAGQIANTPPAGLENITIETGERKHQIGASGDYLIGYGQLSLPFEFALAAKADTGETPTVKLRDRESTYYGATVSYSYGQAWFFDFSFSQGSSTATSDEKLFGFPGNVEYTIDDSWYQLYLRYAFRQLRGKRFFGYVRAGATYVDATLTAGGRFGPVSYAQHNPLTDVEGNVGIGAGYTIIPGAKVRLSATLEGEGFAGTRTQDVTERVAPGFDPASVSEQLHNSLYGGLGRGSLRLEIFPSRSRRLRILADAGVQFRYSVVEYEEMTFRGAKPFAAQSFGETLWGPFVKVGVRFAF